MNDYQNTNYGDIFRPYNHYPASFQARPNRQRPLLGRENLPRIIFWGALIALATVLLSGCATGNGSSVAVTVNVFGSLSRFGQSLGGTDTTIKGQSEGGGNAAATVPLAP
jgi:hypothetical protein